jgi:hypothetical protein
VTFFSASALITIYGLILAGVFLNSKIQSAIGESKDLPLPTAVDRPSIEIPIKFTHEELCDQKLTWENLPDDDS